VCTPSSDVGVRSFAVLLGLLAACSDDDSLVVDLGVITTRNEAEIGPSIQHPASAQAGTDVSVTAQTYGTDCTGPERTDVKVTGLNAVIRPFDRNFVESVCGDLVWPYRHTTSIRFEEAGTATITVFGYEEGDRFGTVIQRSSTLEIQ
jgi:hypothetical protein